MRRWIAFMLLAGTVLLSACGGSGGGPSTVSQQVPAAGGTVSLSKNVTLQIPPGAVADATKVTITKKNAPDGSLAGGQSLGSGFNIDLGGQKLSKPVTLEIAFDPKKIGDATTGKPFLSYYDEAKHLWVPVGGTVDTQRNVITIQTDHLSWWNPFSWNWGAWMAVLDNALTGNVTDFLHAVALLTNDCPQSGTTVSVDASKANSVIQGCVQHDDLSSPQLRIVNPKSFFFEVKPISGGDGYPPDTMLGPGDDLKFQASTSDPAPLVVQAEITQKAGLYLVVHLIIQMLPGLNELGIQGPQIACITEKLSDVSYFVSASEALLVDHDGAAAAEQLAHFLNDGGAVQRFITAASDCNYGAAPTWSVEGIKQIGTATATIISATDFVANYLLSYHSELAFSWTRPPTPTSTPASEQSRIPRPEQTALAGSQAVQSFAEEFLKACWQLDLTRLQDFVEPGALDGLLSTPCSNATMCPNGQFCRSFDIANITPLQGSPRCEDPSPADVANGWGRACHVAFQFAYRAAGSTAPYVDYNSCFTVQWKSERYLVRRLSQVEEDMCN